MQNDDDGSSLARAMGESYARDQTAELKRRVEKIEKFLATVYGKSWATVIREVLPE